MLRQAVPILLYALFGVVVAMEKPLHVRVAEVLGCKPVYSTDPELAAIHGPACWCGDEGRRKGPHSTPRSPLNELARYDTDWSATGPLIEKYELDLQKESDAWMAWDGPEYASGGTPLLAVCNLILALAEAGKL